MKDIDNRSWLIIQILSAFLVGFWVPLRVILYDSHPSDMGFELVVSWFIFWPLLVEFKKNGFSLKTLKTKNFFFIADLLSGIPIASILDYYGMPGAEYFLLFKMLWLRRLFDIRLVLDKYDNLHPVLFRLLPILFLMPTVVHIVACGWVWLGCGTSGVTDDKWFDYFKSVYWAVTTLATVGYGDISAKTLPQMAFASTVMIIGVGFFGFILSNVASLLARLDAARETHLSILDKVESFMSHNQIPPEMKNKVRTYYRYLWETKRGYDDSSILNEMPKNIRGELSLFMNAEMISKVPLFKGADSDLVTDIVLQLKSIIALPNEKVFHVGEPGDEMFFIHNGEVEIILPDGKIVATLKQGAFFGELALLTPNPRSASAKATGYTDLFVLSRESFERVLKRYPEFEKHVHDLAKQRLVKSA